MLIYQAEMVNLQKLKFDGLFLCLLDKRSALHTMGVATILSVIPRCYRYMFACDLNFLTNKNLLKKIILSEFVGFLHFMF
jgi:hypothetical protein